MNEELYLTDTIFLKDNKLYYEEKNQIKEIKKHNWHHILRSYGWEKLHKQWIKKLNGYLTKPNNNSLYGSLDCGGEGDCLFHCISYAINNFQSTEYDSTKLREQLSESITEEKYKIMIECYQILQESNDFEENWDPYNINFNDFKEMIKNGGDEYWGDFLLLNLLKEYLNINFIVLNSNEITNEFYYYPIFHEYNEKLNTVILLYENEFHFQLIGNFQEGNMITLFTHKTIPQEILKLINYLR